MVNPQRTIERNMTEDDLLDFVMDAAAARGWLVHHCRPARSGQGWRTPIQGDTGFPDLVLVHPRRGVIFAELKSERGREREDQTIWGDALIEVRAEYYVWRPRDRDAILERLVTRAP